MCSCPRCKSNSLYLDWWHDYQFTSCFACGWSNFERSHRPSWEKREVESDLRMERLRLRRDKYQRLTPAEVSWRISQGWQRRLERQKAGLV